MKIRGLINSIKHGVLSLVILSMPLTFPSLSDATEDYDWHHNGYPAIDSSQSNQDATYIYTTADVGIGGTYESGVPLKVHGDLRAQGICDENGDNCKDISSGWSTATGDGHSLDAADGSAGNVVYVNNNGNVGIGTTSPMAKLDVEGNVRMSSLQLGGAAEITQGVNNNNLYITGGNVGIGTTSPGGKLAVKSSGMSNVIWAQASDGSNLGGIHEGGDGTASFWLYDASDNMNVLIRGLGDSYLNGGNLGIGTTSPRKPLHVVTSTTDDGAKIESTNAGTHGASLVLYQNSSTPAADDVAGRLQFNGKRDDGKEYWMAYIDGLWTNPAAGTGKSRMAFHTRSGEIDNIAMTLDHNGNVGIGTTSPNYKLHIDSRNVSSADDVHIGAGADGRASISLGTTTGMSSSFRGYFHGSGADSQIAIGADAGYKSSIHFREGVTDKARIFNDAANDALILTDGSDTNTIAIKAGKVGIGTTTPQSKLAVKGTITTKEIKVTETGWADFVFEETYELPSLDSVETFIKENKHLPEIPSAKEVQEQGIAVSEMLAKQMQKIEEMTLYLIQLKKENDQLKKRVSLLEETNNQ